jgi:hypothetical protein
MPALFCRAPRPPLNRAFPPGHGLEGPIGLLRHKPWRPGSAFGYPLAASRRNREAEMTSPHIDCPPHESSSS